jgi:KaiC/GvpD/RAD55 family RecA-like ATPase
MTQQDSGELRKLSTGIHGFDQIANGGFPEARTTLIAGTAGSGKTILALQFLLVGVRDFNQGGVCATFEETPLEITGLFTNTTSMLLGGESITETHISTVTDTIILLRYVELHGDVRRGLAVLKMRGTWHEKEIREYIIDNTGMHLKEPFRGVHGILTGAPTYSDTEERERLSSMFHSTTQSPQ